MAYMEHFHDPRKLAKLIQMRMNIDVHAIVLGLPHELIESESGDSYELYEYFSQVQAMLHRSIFSKDIHLQKETQMLLEILSIPLFQKTKKEQKKILDMYIL